MEKNYRLTISYDGSRFQGWEHQPGTDMTIQGKIENVLLRMLNDSHNGDEHTAISEDGSAFCGQKHTQIPDVICAGRTDAGVHAEAMIANVRLDTEMLPREIREYLNLYLPDDICIRDVSIAGDRFHARYNARGKTYRYTCYVGATKPLFNRKYVYDLNAELSRGKFKKPDEVRLLKNAGIDPVVPDISAMRLAADLLVGEHDFRSFCSNPKMKKSTVRLVDKIDISLNGDFLNLVYHGTGFLQYMVRILTGTLLEVGYGLRKPESMTELLEAKDRRLAGVTAPACGLTMVKVDY